MVCQLLHVPPLTQATAAFNSFLAEAITFYEDLVLDVQAIHGTGDCAVVFEAQGEPNIEHSTAKGKGLTADSASVVPTVARCRMCLGDLARCALSSSDRLKSRVSSSHVVSFIMSCVAFCVIHLPKSIGR
jgi:hypothetical protein